MVLNKRALEESPEEYSFKAIKLHHPDAVPQKRIHPARDNHGPNDSECNQRIPILQEEGVLVEDRAESKPRRELLVMPPIWAQSRQEVCESFAWFRSYQGGVYFSNNLAKGYLLSGYPAKRDGFFHNGKLILSHGGGKAESLQQSKGQAKLKPADDQKADDKSVRALLTNYKQQIPIVLLVDDKYALFPYDLGGKNITYAVLGVYLITHAWAEYETTKDRQKHVRFKFSFQWCEEQGEPWWHATENKSMGRRIVHIPRPIPEIASCTQTPETIDPSGYESDDLMNTSSDSATAQGTPPSSPEKTPSRSSRRTPVKKSQFLLSERAPGLADSRCTHCGLPSPLVFSVGWVCLNSACSRFWHLPGNGNDLIPDELDFHERFLQLQTLAALDEGFRNIEPPQPETSPLDQITTLQSFTRGMHCRECGRLSCRFKWEQWECKHCQNVLRVHGMVRPVKDLRDLQPTAKFEWYSVGKKSGITKKPVYVFGEGNVVTFSLPDGRGQIHHIQHNSRGSRDLARLDSLFEDYQKQAADGSLPFQRHPLRSHKVRGELLTNYFSQNCGEPYHYVGGTDHTLSWEVAPQAVIEAKKFIEERTKQALKDRNSEEFNFNEVLSAAYMEKQKMSFHTDDEKGLGPVVAGLSLGSPALMYFRRRDIKHGPERRICLSIILRHGDILVMDGAGVQEYYEHMVEPTNFRIAATARLINPS
ncbi:hypothetical protein C8R42DRAFT_463116 [Lentinula raphanica]|nr:hypothetical protein C8R42DRAFT_463116 [Lentinula raphanica]